MQPRQWSSTYNEQYRDRRKYVTPFSGYAEPITRTQGYYGRTSALSEHAARTAELQARGLTAPFDSSSYSSYSPSSSSSYSPSSSSSSSPSFAGAQTSRASTAPLSFNNARANSNYNGAKSARYDQYNNRNANTDKDLWTHPILPHTGTYSPYTTMRGGVSVLPASLSSSSSSRYAHNNNANTASHYNNTADTFVSDPRATLEPPSTVPAPRRWQDEGGGEGQSVRYDDNGVAQTKYVDVTRPEEPKVKYYIPGYAGSVRGMNFLHGDTYGKTTRKCLDPPHLPADGY